MNVTETNVLVGCQKVLIVGSRFVDFFRPLCRVSGNIHRVFLPTMHGAVSGLAGSQTLCVSAEFSEEMYDLMKHKEVLSVGSHL